MVRRWDLPFATPCFSTIRSWILRLGCYALSCPLPTNRPWVWLVDHTVQIGCVKLLVILGCPLADVPFGQRCLALADLRLVALVAMEQSTHDRVERELEKATARTGVPREIASDHATDMKKGVEQFCRRHPTTTCVHDIAHYGANVLENRWERNPRWQEFVRQMHQTNQRMRQTQQAYLLSPKLRAKARFMSVGPLLRFAGRVVRLLEGEKSNERAVREYGWVLGFKGGVAGWLEEHGVVQKTIEHVRVYGVSGATLGQLEKEWGPLSQRKSTGMVVGYMKAYARRYGGRAAEGERLVGSTEALESSFGKLKRLEGDESGGGFTGMVLALGAMTGNADEPHVRKALEEVPNKEAQGWINRTLGHTLRWLRHHILGPAES
jgi:hypothetical protein